KKQEIQMKHISLNVPISYFCNQKCVFCIDKEKHNFSYINSEKSTEEIMLFLEENAHKYEKVMFTYGEPTLNKNISLYIKKAKDLGYKEIGMVTNGSLMHNNKLRKELIESGLDLIIFSIHGSNSVIHDSLVQVPGNFKKAFKGLLLCKKEYKNLDIKVSYVLNKNNLNDLNTAIKLFSKIGVNNIIINTIRPNGYSEDYNYHVNVYNFKDFINYINSLDKKDVDLMNKLIKNQILNFTDIPICVLKKTSLDIFSYGKVEIRVVKYTNKETYLHDTIDEKQYLSFCKKCEYLGECEGIYNKYIIQFGIKYIKNLL
ncbi:MAG: radical SAM protein, partial [Candidatus Gracilibacteria bacterium]|nr:radical SAM protein [Candidatus Gracilibacteria bacterium]